MKILHPGLDFTKIEAGQLQLESLDFHVRDCVEDALDGVATKAAEKNLYLAFLAESDVPYAIVGDQGRLRQILLNLLNNALKFTFQGEVVVRVSVEPLVAAGANGHAPEGAGPAASDRTEQKAGDKPDDAPGAPALAVVKAEPGPMKQKLHFVVSDTGIGIPADKLDRLFRSFSQVEASHARRFGGSGLGLAISKRLAEAMGGEMWVESKEGVGSAFHFTIVAETSSKIQVPLRNRNLLAKKRILIVDDHKAHNDLLVELLRNAGVKATALSSEEFQQRALAGFEWEALILDSEDNLHLTQPLAVPTLLLTPLGKSTSNLSDSGDGGVIRISKPIKQNKLEVSLVNLLNLAAPQNFDFYLAKTLSADFAPHAAWSNLGRGDANHLQVPDGALVHGSVPHEPESAHAQGSTAFQPVPSATGQRFAVGEAADKPLRILLVEDNAINQQIALRIMKKGGFAADVANNGLEGVNAITERVYDCVLMDVQMPILDGFEATKRIREEIPQERQPTIIALTANALLNEREACLQAGMDSYLSKPVDAKHLIASIKACRRLAAEAVVDGVDQGLVAAGDSETTLNSGVPDERTALITPEKAE
ncbi:hypothetical protein DFJ74DRAFT_679463 [Hyaloraphidium curvatum]|nr:hypothetical protein DFJ74DRAFT_679463 [Hyaloraphidium curvatum]